MDRSEAGSLLHTIRAASCYNCKIANATLLMYMEQRCKYLFEGKWCDVIVYVLKTHVYIVAALIV